MGADRLGEDRTALHEMLNAARRRDADRVGEDELVGGVEALTKVGNNSRVDLTLERAAPRTRDGDRCRNLRGGDDRAHALHRLLERRVAVAAAETLRGSQRSIEPLPSRLPQPPNAA